MSVFGDEFVKEVEGALGHNRRATDDAEDLLDVFSRVPEEIDQATVGRAITLAKQMKLAADDLEQARKEGAAELRERLADLERPYKLTHERLEESRQEMLERLAAWLTKVGKGREKNEFGLLVYTKVTTGWEIEDAAQVPREFCEPSATLISGAIKAGARIPGVLRVEKTQTIVV